MTPGTAPDWYNPQALNRYSYCLNNPLKFVDPTGHISDAAALAAAEESRKLESSDSIWDDFKRSINPIYIVKQTYYKIKQPIQYVNEHPKVAVAIVAIPPEAAAIILGGSGTSGTRALQGAVAAEETTVIGRVKDLQSLKPGERSLLDRLPNQGSPKANWTQNSGVLRQEMAKGQPIRDASPGDTAGRFLNAERNLLKDHGWTFDPNTNYWMPPKQ